MDVGVIHYQGETAEFYVLVSSIGKSIDANISAILRAEGYVFEDLTESVEQIAKGFYRIPYEISWSAPTGTYVMVVEAQYHEVKGTSLKSFLLYEQEPPPESLVAVAVDVVIGTVSSIAALVGAYFYIKRKRPNILSGTGG